MTLAYVDTSAIVRVAFGEEGGIDVERRLARFRNLISSNLLEAEVRSTFARERIPFPRNLLNRMDWLHPGRPLTPEIESVLAAGYLRGADLWHVATALHLPQEPAEVTFLTQDRRQRNVAEALGFRV